ncbi:MAG: penicillin-binding protein 1C, partial [Treponema sp.]|nr:penicillin-binding protein 1C [Treponema sp.]
QAQGAPLSELCPYCMSVSLSPDGKYRISVQDMTDKYEGALPKIEKFFVLPPTVEYYYKKTNYSYKTLPPYFEGIHSKNSARDFSIMFPEENANIIIPIEIDGRLGNMVMQVIHRKKDADFTGTLTVSITAKPKMFTR